jgi:hypothetical protein
VYHHATESRADPLHGPLDYTILVVAVAAAVFTRDTILVTHRVPGLAGVERFTISAKYSQLVGSMFVVMFTLESQERGKGLVFTLQYIKEAFTVVVVDDQLEAVIAILGETDVHVFPVVDTC